MKEPIASYLARRADLASRPLLGDTATPADQCVVIPCLAEADTLPSALESLAANPPGDLARTLVICVVNNPPMDECAQSTIEDNQRALRFLSSYTGLRIAWIDAASPGRELGKGKGVGLARKLGMDSAVEVLHRSRARPGIILSLDADTLVEPNYLAAVPTALSSGRDRAAVIAYAHQRGATPRQDAAILAYELYLRYCELGLRYAGSPYAFHTIGSAMACTVGGYVGVSGMNRRTAAEDFYFLQQMAKTGPVTRIASTTVHPSARPSWRVPFGTGIRVSKFLAGDSDTYRVYNPESYGILKRWLAVVNAAGPADPLPVDVAKEIHPEVRAFLDRENFSQIWRKISKNAANSEAFRMQLHRWFDALKTLRLIHHLRDRELPNVPMFEGIAALLKNIPLDPPFCVKSIGSEDCELQWKLLDFLRMGNVSDAKRERA